MMKHFSRALAGMVFTLLTVVIASSARAQTWNVTTADFNTMRADVRRIDESGVGVETRANGETSQKTIGFDDFLLAARRDPAIGNKGKFELRLTNGDLLYGEPASIKDETLGWQNRFIGAGSFPMSRLSSMIKTGETLTSSDAAPAQDTVRLSNGDVVSGVVTEVTAQAITVKSAAPVEVPMASVIEVRFAKTAAASAAENGKRAFRLGLIDGSAITVSDLKFDGANWKMSLAPNARDAAERTTDSASVASVEQVNGPVSWLSSREPSEQVQTPYSAETLTWPARWNTSVDGNPIRFGGKTFARGIGVHSYSKLVFPLDGTYPAFRTQYAIDESQGLSLADVVVRVKVDGLMVHEQAGIRSGTLSPVVVINLKNAKELTLEVDYGNGFDVQDRLNWIEPALLRTMPAKEAAATTVPATQP